MATETKPSDMSPAVQAAWGRALIKTGTEHLDLPMVRSGKEELAEAKTRDPEAPPPKR
jgi:hypothetical protein